MQMREERKLRRSCRVSGELASPQARYGQRPPAWVASCTRPVCLFPVAIFMLASFQPHLCCLRFPAGCTLYIDVHVFLPRFSCPYLLVRTIRLWVGSCFIYNTTFWLRFFMCMHQESLWWIGQGWQNLENYHRTCGTWTGGVAVGGAR